MGDKAEMISKTQRKLCVDTVVAMMEADGLEWGRPWVCSFAPFNYESGRAYHGCNRGLLASISIAMGYNDPRWITPTGAKRLAEKRGEKWNWAGQTCWYVECWKPHTWTRRDENGDAVLDENGNPICGTYMKLVSVHPILNLAQIQGAPAYEPAHPGAAGDFSTAERLISGYFAREGEQRSGCTLIESGTSDMAFYSTASDSVTIPERTRFKGADGFCATLAHEAIHSTGHPARLDRKLQNSFGSVEYAEEELVAELGSIMLCSDLGICYTMHDELCANHAAYLASWKAALRGKDGADILVKAQTAADKAADYVWGFLKEEADEGVA